MAQGNFKNGVLELKYNEDRTQVLATIHPPMRGGEPIPAAEVVTRLKKMGTTYGIREQAVRDAVHYAQNNGMTANAVVAQGVVPKDGTDAVIHYRLPLELLARPIVKGPRGLPDWFALDSATMVQADAELAAIVPASAGIPGKTLTWPIQAIAPRPGRPAALSAGAGVRPSDDGLRLYADADGSASLQGERLIVYAFRVVSEPKQSETLSFTHGGVFQTDVSQSQIQAGDFVAIKGCAKRCHIRARGDVFLTEAEECIIVADGDVYVTSALVNCNIITHKRVIAEPGSTIVGGQIYALEGVEAGVVGAEDFTATEIRVGIDRFAEVRMREIEEDLAACEANRGRIGQALKPFASLAVHTALPDDKRALLQKLQTQHRTQEMRLRELLNEKRILNVSSKERRSGTVKVVDTAYPGVWIGIGNAEHQIEVPMDGIQFTDSQRGKSIISAPLRQAA